VSGESAAQAPWRPAAGQTQFVPGLPHQGRQVRGDMRPIRSPAQPSQADPLRSASNACYTAPRLPERERARVEMTSGRGKM